MSDTYLDRNEESKARRRHNRINSAIYLQDREIEFTSHNGGAHLVVYHNGKVVDFWPGTGKWCLRPEQHYQRGVKRLVRMLNR